MEQALMIMLQITVNVQSSNKSGSYLLTLNFAHLSKVSFSYFGNKFLQY